MSGGALHAPDFLWDYRCNQRGCCCGPWTVGLREDDFHRLRLALKGTELEGEVSSAVRLKAPSPFASVLPATSQVGRFDAKFAFIDKRSDGACAFLASDDQCRIHATAGEEALPQLCRNFPISALETPEGSMAFWDLLCPEVANLLAAASKPAAIVPTPEAFERVTYVFRPGAPMETVSLTAKTTVPFADYVTFREDTARALAEGHAGPLQPLSRLVAHVRAWMDNPERGARLSARPVDDDDYAALLSHLTRCAEDAAREPERFRTKVAFARRFFAHHAWGTDGVLDVLESGELPSAQVSLAQLAGAGPEVHVALTNYLLLKLWNIPLAHSGSIDGGLRELLRRLGTGMYLAGALALARGGRLTPEHLVAAVAFADVAYRVNAPAPKRVRIDVRAPAGAPARTGQLEDLMVWKSQGAQPPRASGGFVDDAAALAALTGVLRARAQVALETHATGVKRGVKAARAGGDFDVAPSWAPGQPTAQVAALQAQAEEQAAAFMADLRGADAGVALARVARRLSLAPMEVEALGVLLANQTEVAWSRSLAHVTLDYGDRSPTLRSLEVLLGPEARRWLGAQGRLRRLHLVTARGDGVAQDNPDVRLELPSEVVGALLGNAPAWPAALGCMVSPEARVGPWIAPPADTGEALSRAVAQGAEGGGVIALVGPEGIDRVGLVRQVLDRPVFAVHLEAEAVEKKAGTQAIYLAARHAVMAGAECLFEMDAKVLGNAAARQALVDAAQLVGGPLFVATELSPSALYGRLPLQEVKVPGATLADRTKALIRTLPQDVMLTDAATIQGVLKSLAIPPSRIPGAVDRIVGEALVEAAGSGRGGRGGRPKIPAERLRSALREQLTSRIGDYAHAVTPGGSWDDLQLEPESKSRLREVVTAYQHRDTVLNGWGFAGTGAAGNGVTALFYGPPGTGKTMSAGIVAGELGLEVFQVDLSRVVDKYIGETEKALGKVFDEAQRGEVLLLFDEADSLFGSRTEVQSSTDRYANLEVNYLLQRIEAYTGIVVLTTNHESLIDPAFRRRLKYQVHFPLPAAEERAGIWRSLIPEELPVADDLDYEELGHRFEFSGGHVKNAVLTAAILATTEDAIVSMRHLTEGGNREYRSLGKIVREYEDE